MAEQPPVVDLERLVADHHGVVYRYAYRLAGAVAEAEDLAQQTFLLAQASLAQLRDPAAARGWLCAIVRNAYHKSVRQRRPCAAVDLELNVDEIADDLPAEDYVDRERLQQSLDELPAEYKIVLLMYYFEDHSYREIAAELQLPLGTVMSRLSRAKSHLRQRLLAAELNGVGGRGHGAAIDRG